MLKDFNSGKRLIEFFVNSPEVAAIECQSLLQKMRLFGFRSERNLKLQISDKDGACHSREINLGLLTGILSGHCLQDR